MYLLSLGFRVRDIFTSEIAKGVHQWFVDDRQPHLVMLRLHRGKLDVNRQRNKAAEHESALQVWDEYHGAIKVGSLFYS